jgi:hypothetical protein
MRACNYCRRWFRSKQAVRAHLKHCVQWNGSEAKVRLDEAKSEAGILAKIPRHARIVRGVCGECGATSTDLGRCVCGSTTLISMKSEPRRCPRCARWIATLDRGPWNGRCQHCGEAMSTDALRAERDALRARLGECGG